MAILLYAYGRTGRHRWANFGLLPPLTPYTRIQTLPSSDTTTWKFVSLDYMYRLAMLGLPLPFERNIVGFDEMQYSADARTHQDLSQRIMSYLEIQGRKRHTVYIYISKRSKLVDVRLRDRDIAFSCEKHHYYTGEICFEDECFMPDGNQYPAQWLLNTDKSTGKVFRPHWFRYDKLDLRNSKGRTIKLGYNQVLPFFKMYDTEELLAPISAYDEREMQKLVQELIKGEQ